MLFADSLIAISIFCTLLFTIFYPISEVHKDVLEKLDATF